MRELLKVGGLVAVLIGAMGCATKEDRGLYTKLKARQAELKTLQQSEKIILADSDANSTIVIATYLPQARAKEEQFILAVYPQEGWSKDSFTLGGAKAKKLFSLSRRDLPASLRRTLPEWFGLYSVVFPHQSAKRFVLSVQDAQGTQGSAIFYKGPKYLITRPRF